MKQYLFILLFFLIGCNTFLCPEEIVSIEECEEFSGVLIKNELEQCFYCEDFGLIIDR